jgi:dTDP-4-amino-4,6-dideoxygalactose transaminase
LSFHETKNIICGEGGALLINAPEYIERAEIIREKGTNRSRLFRGEIDKYTWIDIGSSYLPSDMLAAFLYAQLEAKDNIQSRRKAIWHYYNDSLADWASANRVGLPFIPEHCQQSYHMFYMVMPSNQDRDALIAHLGENNIKAVFHYLPLHLSAMGAEFGIAPEGCSVTERISEGIIRLPFFSNLSEDQQHFIVDSVRSFRGG